MTLCITSHYCVEVDAFKSINVVYSYILAVTHVQNIEINAIANSICLSNPDKTYAISQTSENNRRI